MAASGACTSSVCTKHGGPAEYVLGSGIGTVAAVWQQLRRRAAPIRPMHSLHCAQVHSMGHAHRTMKEALDLARVRGRAQRGPWLRSGENRVQGPWRPASGSWQ